LALTNASDPKKTPADTRVALAKRLQSGRSHTSDQSSSSSGYDPFSSIAFSFSSTDSGSSNDSGSSSNDYSSSTDYSSSSDSGSSSSDSGSSSSSD
jgi:hypothetical protein